MTIDRWWWLVFSFNPIGDTPMTTPAPTTAHKAVVASIGGVLVTIVPILEAVGDFLPQPWPAIITGLIALLTVLGVYKVENKPKSA